MPISLHTPQVTRIPIAGPAPYNTLVAVTAMGQVGPGGNFQQGDKNTYRSTNTVSTSFILAGFDQRVTVDFQHSTTAYLIKTPSAEADNFIYAADGVATAGFSSENGEYYVTVDTAIQLPDNYLPTTPEFFGGFLEDCRLYISSFVLIYEPPPPAQPGTPSGQSSGLGRFSHGFKEKGNLPSDLTRKITQK